MPEHVHLLIWPDRDDDRVAGLQQFIKQSVARTTIGWINRHMPASLDVMADVAPSGKTAHRFWQRGAGYDRNLFTAKAIWGMIEYIHQNPIRRGLCARAEDWAWSSIHEFRAPGTGALRIDFESIPLLPARKF